MKDMDEKTISQEEQDRRDFADDMAFDRERLREQCPWMGDGEYYGDPLFDMSYDDGWGF